MTGHRNELLKEFHQLLDAEQRDEDAIVVAANNLVDVLRKGEEVQQAQIFDALPDMLASHGSFEHDLAVAIALRKEYKPGISQENPRFQITYADGEERSKILKWDIDNPSEAVRVRNTISHAAGSQQEM